jgi:hypothetical protein
MAAGPTEDRVILTVAAVGSGIASDPEKIERLLRHQKLQEVLEPFRKKDAKRGRAFGQILDEQAEKGEDEGETAG